jgi:transglutaminase-like putative cysteine protease
VGLERKRQLTIVYEFRYRLTEMELISGLVLKNGRRRRIRDGDLKVSKKSSVISIPPLTDLSTGPDETRLSRHRDRYPGPRYSRHDRPEDLVKSRTTSLVRRGGLQDHIPAEEISERHS